MLNALQDLPLMREIYEEGIEKGRTEGHISLLISLYESRLGPMQAPVREALAAISSDEALRSLLPLFLRGGADEIAAALMAR